MTTPFYHELIREPPPSEDQDQDHWQHQVTDALNNQLRVEPYKTQPTSITKTAGGTAVGAVANVQTILDGDVYQVPEVAATPGYDVKFNFTGLTFSPNAIMVRAWYDGLAAHEVTVEMYDYDAAAYVTIHQWETSLTYKIEFIPFPIDANYVSAEAAIMRFIHNTGGSSNHDVYWDFVSLWKFT